MWTFSPSPLVDERTPTAVITAVYLLAGLLMAATVAAVTALPACRFARAAPAHLPGKPPSG